MPIPAVTRREIVTLGLPADPTSRLLRGYISAGLLFLLLPGTLLGVWNLLEVRGRGGVDLVSPAWLQAHGHAQIFGWVGTFILGIGFYSLSSMRAGVKPSLRAGYIVGALWIAGVLMRWSANISLWHWRVLLPVSAALELAGLVVFLRNASRHPPGPGGARFPPWVRIVMCASAGFTLTVLANLAAAIEVAWRGDTPALPRALDQRYLVLATWGFLAPFIWGFSTNWLPVLLGLRRIHTKPLVAGVVTNAVGVGCALCGWAGPAVSLLLAGAVLVIVALRLFERPAAAAKTRGVHASFPVFIRLAYAWLVIAAALGVAAARWDVSDGIRGASRHAFTVGFVSTIVFAIGQRMLPAFAGGRVLWSRTLMFAALALLTAGCLLRVPAEIAAYERHAAWAWSLLPTSAFLELGGVTAFALNLIATLYDAPPLVRRTDPV